MNNRGWLVAPVLVLASGVVLWLTRDVELGSRAARRGATPVELAEPVVEIVSPQAPKSEGPTEEEKCASGCSMKKHRVPPFTETLFDATLKAFARQRLPAGAESSVEVDRLLFYGRRTSELLRLRGAKPLPESHRRWLRAQLARTHAQVALRIVDERGRLRANLPWTRVPFGIKQHLRPRTLDIQPMEFNGTLMRTGLGHIWARY